MAAIQKLYEVCKASLSEKGPSSPEAVENVRAVLDMITPSDVGLECEAQAVRVWRRPRVLNRKTVLHSSPAIRYRHIYECKSFSHLYDCITISPLLSLVLLICFEVAQCPFTFSLQIGIYCIPASSIIPLHNHPGMTVLSKLLYGKVHVKAYDWIDIEEPGNLSKVRPAKVVRDGEISAPCAAMVLCPTGGGNVHALKAITPCAILDILSPPYSSKDGRHCSYFRRRQKSHPTGQCRDLPWTKNNHDLLTKDGFSISITYMFAIVSPGILWDRTRESEFVWLEEYQPRDNFVIRRDLYTGPTLEL
ncbi:2-aminoethanethiol dioxygenase [Triticum urartu]|uniref:cysteine dioxygenase n=1 Tax=Triticum urartu TaxID=4572 RepID=M7ZUY5_TRIUA|nr:2-aminoethanethiol dioxygenase [Triticum urartu]